MGLFSLVLHTHLPYVRRNGVWPSGEDFFHQAAVESYLPMLGVLRRLGERGARDLLSVGLSPLVAHQMSDPHMRRELELYLGRIELRAWRQVANYSGPHEHAVKDLAAFTTRFARTQGALLEETTDLAAAFAELARAGVVEVLGGPATHAYLPLVREPFLLDAQVALGAAQTGRLLGSRVAGAWLPECAWRPGAGLEEALARAGIGHLVVDGPTMLRSAGPGSTFTPRRIAGSDVVAFARNLDLTYRVWSPTGGYPTGRWYRDFFHYDLEGGFKNWRVTGVRIPLERKRPYEPERAQAAARADAERFAAEIARALDAHERATGRPGIVVAAYDTELFGHWWFEGPAFVERLFEVLDETPRVTPCSLARALELLPEPEPVELAAGSWGFRKDDRSWVAPETQDMWAALGEVEAETVALVRKLTDPVGAKAEARAQLIREALLLQASDWPFMVLRGRNAVYARERFETHRARWTALSELLRGRAPDHVTAREARTLFDIDNILPALDEDLPALP